jgi:hypothetical protein
MVAYIHTLAANAMKRITYLLILALLASCSGYFKITPNHIRKRILSAAEEQVINLSDGDSILTNVIIHDNVAFAQGEALIKKDKGKLHVYRLGEWTMFAETPSNYWGKNIYDRELGLRSEVVWNYDIDHPLRQEAVNIQWNIEDGKVSAKGTMQFVNRFVQIEEYYLVDFKNDKNGYYTIKLTPQDAWKYYDKEGKLVKEQVYHEGKLLVVKEYREGELVKEKKYK